MHASTKTTTSPITTRRNQRRRARVPGGGGSSRIGVSASTLMSEGHRDREGEAELARTLGVREVEGEGTGRRLEARTHAVALVRLPVPARVRRVAHVDEGRRAPFVV